MYSIFSKSLKGFSSVLILLFLVLVVVAGASYFYLNSQKSSGSSLVGNKDLLTGKLHKLDEDLGLITQSEYIVGNIKPQVDYYEAGTFVSGKYRGYKRYVAVRKTNGPGGPGTYVFASLDSKTYILDGDPIDINSITGDVWDNPVYEIDKTKVTKIDTLDTQHSPAIALDSRFSLNRNHIAIDSLETNRIDEYGNTLNDEALVTDFSAYAKLKSPNPQLSFYSRPKIIDALRSSDPTDLVGETAGKQFIDGTTQVVVVDSTGLAYTYDLADPKSAAIYPKELGDYKKAMEEYLKLLKLNSPTALSPDYPKSPNLRISKNDIKSALPLYEKYDVAIPAGCATDANTLVVKNISGADLQEIGDSPRGKLFSLKDKDHALYATQYKIKTGYEDETFMEVNKRSKPGIEEYAGKNPLLFLQDYWGRWVMLGEFDFLLPGGCGKPVVYLYPTKPTEISVSFTSHINFDVAIPQYVNGWNVLAQPDGTLTDLQPEATDCSSIDVTRKGSEYAKEACLANSYPYLYWAGQSTEREYPEITKGWVVERGNLVSFINDKFNEIGFTQREKQDFMSYWLPEMLKKNAAYYRVSFLQNSQVNQIIPMQIIPQPKSYYRLFMDYEPLSSKPSVDIEPQDLGRIVRDGFTVVEWGGLKQ